MNVTFQTESIGNNLVFSIIGKIASDLDTQGLLDTLQTSIDAKVDNILFDLTKLDYITSTGLNFFVRSLTRTRNNEIGLVLYGLQKNVEKLFYISKLNEIFIILADKQEALDKVNTK